MTTKELVKKAYNALEDKKAVDTLVLDISGISIMADYFMIASGTNKNQIQAMADNVEEALAACGCHPKQIEGYDTAGWILMDYGDFIIHVFSESDRLFYDLERIWRDGKLIDAASLDDDDESLSL